MALKELTDDDAEAVEEYLPAMSDEIAWACMLARTEGAYIHAADRIRERVRLLRELANYYESKGRN